MLKYHFSKWLVAFLIVAVSSIVIHKLAKIIFIDPEEAFEKFLSANDLPEDALMDPLILAGKPVVPIVLDALGDKKLKRRRYAIGFLGNGGYKEALPMLQRIAADESEEKWIREDALESIYLIDEKLGLKLVTKYQSSGLEPFLGHSKRGFLEALMNWHQ